MNRKSKHCFGKSLALLFFLVNVGTAADANPRWASRSTLNSASPCRRRTPGTWAGKGQEFTVTDVKAPYLMVSSAILPVPTATAGRELEQDSPWCSRTRN